MIKTSALLVALAIGLLVAGVAASSLLMVYVSIGVCAVAALLLAAGVLAHWSEIFGRREARPASAGGLVRAAGARHCPGTGQHPGRRLRPGGVPAPGREEAARPAGRRPLG